MRKDVEFTGFDELTARIKKLELDFDLVKDEAEKAAADHLRDEVEKHPNVPRSKLPKPHGQDNFKVQKDNINGGYAVGIDKDHWYLIFHEVGAQGGLYKGKQDWNKDMWYKTPDIPAMPFMQPTLITESENMQDKMANVLKKALKL